MQSLGFFGKLRLAVHAMVALSKNIVDPWGQLAFQWAMDGRGIARVMERARATPDGVSLLTERPRFDLDLARCATMPEGSLGRFLFDWFRAWRLEPFAPRRAPRGDLEYFVDRLFFTHDVWHATVGLGTDLRNELRFLGVLLSQYGSGSAVLALAAGWFKVPAEYGWRAFAALPFEVWRFYRWGKGCKPLSFVRWEDYLEQPLERVRKELLAKDRPRIGEWQAWPTARVVLPPQVTRPNEGAGELASS